MRSLLTAAFAAALTVILAGAARAADEWGTVKGQVTWGGKAPPPEVKIDTSKEPKCAKCNVIDEKYIVGKNGGVKYVIVWLQKGDNFKAKLPIHPALKAIKDKEVVIDQPCCKFEPRVLAIRQGQKIIGKNSSEIAHNMKWTGGNDNPGDNKLIPGGGKIEIDLVASKSAVIVECNIHPWMKGWVRVFDHPYFAVTDADGKFEIKNAPAGKYNIVMWQEEAGWVNGGTKAGQEIEIPAGGTVEVNEKVKPEEK
jgi:plastocyanin